MREWEEKSRKGGIIFTLTFMLVRSDKKKKLVVWKGEILTPISTPPPLYIPRRVLQETGLLDSRIETVLVVSWRDMQGYLGKWYLQGGVQTPRWRRDIQTPVGGERFKPPSAVVLVVGEERRPEHPLHRNNLHLNDVCFQLQLNLGQIENLGSLHLLLFTRRAFWENHWRRLLLLRVEMLAVFIWWFIRSVSEMYYLSVAIFIFQLWKIEFGGLIKAKLVWIWLQFYKSDFTILYLFAISYIWLLYYVSDFNIMNLIVILCILL